jgi:hypothetical protein
MSGFPSRFLRQIAVAVLLLNAGVGVARAQHHNDFTSVNGTFSTSQASPVMISPSQMGISAPAGKNLFIGSLPSLSDSINNTDRSTLSGQTFSKFNSPINGDKSTAPQWKTNFPIGQNLPLKMAPSPQMKKPQMLTNMENKSALNDYTNRGNLESHQSGPPKFTDGFTFHAVDNGTQLEQAGRDLSLQDVNRYQFQGSFSSQPGLPVVHAGGQGNKMSVSGSSLSSIANSPTLFDSNSMPTSSVRSGASVAPRVITSEGSMAYMPHNPLSPISLGGADSKSGGGYQTIAQGSLAPSDSNAKSTSLSGGIYHTGSYTIPTSAGGSAVPIDVDTPEYIIHGDKNSVSLSPNQ